MSILNIETGETSHEGRVVGTETDHSVRIMSDVWSDLHYVLVYEPSQEASGVASQSYSFDEHKYVYGSACGTIRRICVSNSEMPCGAGKGYEWRVDGSDEAMAALEGWQAGRKLASLMERYNTDERYAANRRREIVRDCTVRVTRGRKVPVGTEGKVFWIGNNGYGMSVGIGVASEDGSYQMVEKVGRYGDKVFKNYADVRFTAIGNVERISKLGGRIL